MQATTARQMHILKQMQLDVLHAQIVQLLAGFGFSNR